MKTSRTDNIVTYLVSEDIITYSMPISENWMSTGEQEDSLTDGTNNNG